MRLSAMLAGIVIHAIAARLMIIQEKPEESRKFSLSAMVGHPHFGSRLAAVEVNSDYLPR